MSRIVPLRKFIYDRLYHPKQGYFCKQDFQVGELSHPINFKNLIGFDDYQQQLYKRYPKNAWLTPSEIFKPYYGMSIANYIIQAANKYPSFSKKIKIVEVGGGTGSAAESILFYFQNFQQKQFQNIEYNIVQISPTLCQHMEQKLRKSFPQMLETKKLKIINQDIANYSSKNQITFLLFFQVLDNLPHDKVILNPETKRYDKFAVADLQSKQQQYKSIESDHLIKQCLDLYLKCQKFKNSTHTTIGKGFLDSLASKIFDKYYKPKMDESQLFLPTYYLDLMKKIKENIPKVHLIISDFDHLISEIPGINAPIVSHKGKESAQKRDYNTYLVERGEADIFFPTNFNLISMINQSILNKSSHVIKSYEFFEEFSHQKWAVSKSGFNPIRQDFSNTSFLLTKI